jgi:hypothetical protein
MKNAINWEPNLCERFLNLKPRPTMKEMSDVILSSPLGRTSSAEIQGSKHVPRKPVPDRPGWYMKDYKKYEELIVQEARNRKELMLEVIRKRHKDIDGG